MIVFTRLLSVEMLKAFLFIKYYPGFESLSVELHERTIFKLEMKGLMEESREKSDFSVEMSVIKNEVFVVYGVRRIWEYFFFGNAIMSSVIVIGDVSVEKEFISVLLN